MAKRNDQRKRIWYSVKQHTYKKKHRQSSQPFAWQHFDLYDSVKSQLTSALVKVLNRIDNEVFPTK